MYVTCADSAFHRSKFWQHIPSHGKRLAIYRRVVLNHLGSLSLSSHDITSWSPCGVDDGGVPCNFLWRDAPALTHHRQVKHAWLTREERVMELDNRVWSPRTKATQAVWKRRDKLEPELASWLGASYKNFRVPTYPPSQRRALNYPSDSDSSSLSASMNDAESQGAVSPSSATPSRLNLSPLASRTCTQHLQEYYRHRSQRQRSRS